MPIIQGSTPEIKVVISFDEVAYNDISKVFFTFAQKGTTISGLNTSFTKTQYSSKDSKTVTYSKQLTQSDTLGLIKDVDLDCQIDVLTTGGNRKISKVFSFGVCESLRNSVLT